MTLHTQDFAYQEEDREGRATLEAIAAADQFNTWMATTVADWMVPGTVLEVGSGIGNISAYFLAKGYQITLSDIRPSYCEELTNMFAGYSNLQGVRAVDLVHPAFEAEYADLLGSFDNVYALNVIEHIEDDSLALANCQRLLRPGGRLIILVPAWQALYNTFDVSLQHYRRYTARTMQAAFKRAGVPVIKHFYFNLMGIAGWFFSGHILRKKVIPSGQMKLYNQLVPVFKLIDWLTGRRVGLSVIVVGQN
ncbi:MAG: methyltransferase domain-containing protein [Bacteroidia bacterium]|nr:methyltransferase domain-containing protein [Bacteroidia bacterium]